MVMIMGEITTNGYVDIPGIARKVIKDIGYTGGMGFDGDNCSVLTAIDEQSCDIALGVDKALEAKEGKYDQKKHRARLDCIIERWDQILAVINEELPTVTELTALYDTVGMPKSMSEIGIDGGLLKMTFAAAKDIRDKYVLPRLAFDLGIIDDISFE